MRLSHLLLTPSFASVFLFTSGLSAKTDYATLLPASTDLYVEVGSLSKLETLESFPIFKMFQSEELKKFFAPLLKKIDSQSEASTAAARKIFEQETGLTEKELDAKFPHGLSFSIYDYLIQPKAGISWSLEAAILAEFSGDEALAEKLFTAIGKVAQHERTEAEIKAKKDNTSSSENEEEKEDTSPSAHFPDDYIETKTDYKGVSLHLWKLKPDTNDMLDQFAWAVHDGILIISSAENEMKSLIDRAKSGSTNDTLAGSASYRDVLDRAGTSDILVTVNLTGVVKQGISKIAETSSKTSKPNQFSPSKLVDILGASDLRNLFFTMNFEAEQADLNYGLTYVKMPGLFSLFPFGPGAGTPPAFLPADSTAASYGRLDIAGMVTAVEKLVSEVYPPAGIIVGGQLAQLKAATGVDLKADLLANLDSELFTIAELPAPQSNVDEKDENSLESIGQQNQVFGIKLKDRSAFELALKSMINGLAPDKAIFEPREYLGFKIQTFKGSEGTPMPVAYVLTDDYLLISVGQSSLIEKLLARISKKATDGIFSDPTITAALNKFPEGAVSVSYQDLDSIAQLLFKALVAFTEQASEITDMQIVDGEHLPKNLKFPHFMISKAYVDDKAMVARLRLLLRPESK